MKVIKINNTTKKECTKCKEIKPLNDFWNDKQAKLGKYRWCRECGKEHLRIRRSDPFIYAQELKRSRERRAEPKYNAERNRKRREQYANDPKARENARIATRRYALDSKNREKINARTRKFGEKYRKTPRGKLNNHMRVLIYDALKNNKNGCSWEKLVAYSVKDLKRHLEKQFQPGMTWENYGYNGWHIDHKIPRAVFNFTSADHIDFRRCWCLENLQPMWAEENFKKSNKLEKPFQPSLAL